MVWTERGEKRLSALEKNFGNNAENIKALEKKANISKALLLISFVGGVSSAISSYFFEGNLKVILFEAGIIAFLVISLGIEAWAISIQDDLEKAKDRLTKMRIKAIDDNDSQTAYDGCEIGAVQFSIQLREYKDGSKAAWVKMPDESANHLEIIINGEIVYSNEPSGSFQTNGEGNKDNDTLAGKAERKANIMKENVKDALKLVSDKWEGWLEQAGKTAVHLSVKQKVKDAEKAADCIRENTSSDSAAREKLDRICTDCLPKFKQMVERYENIYKMDPLSVETENAGKLLERAASALASALDKIRDSVVEEEGMQLAAEVDAFTAMLAGEGLGKTMEDVCREARERKEAEEKAGKEKAEESTETGEKAIKIE